MNYQLLMLVGSILCGSFLFLAFMKMSDKLLNNEMFSLSHNQSRNPKHQLSVKNNNQTEEEVDPPWQCKLPVYDAWDKEIQPYYNPRRNIESNCTKIMMLTMLTGMKVYKTNNEYHCYGRCLLRGTEYKNTYGDWIKLDKENGTLFKCDIIETICSNEEDMKKIIYDMVHYQIVPKKKIPAKKKFDKKVKQYNVHVILVDSLSTSQADRQLANTLRYLEKSMGAVSFPYLNKVGANSRPNGIAVWFGKQLESIDRSIFGLPSIPADEEMCEKFVDNMSNIFTDFREYGYRTLLAEGELKGCVNYPNCKGFYNEPTDHYMRPMQVETYLGNKLLVETYTSDHCFADHRYLMDYQEQFMDAYPNDLLFSWLWTVHLGHYHPSDVIRGDIDILEKLMKVREKIDNSFVILLGDHGFRLGGKVLKTKIGAMDVNNPSLTIALPKDLRNNKNLVNMMKENSQKLLTHHDVRATILDLIKYQPLTNFTSYEKLKMKGEKGNSLFRKMDGERSCRTLPIPLGYCLCEYPKDEINTTSKLALDLGRKVVELANFRLKENNVSHKCAVWKFDKVTSLSGYKPHLTTGAYTISVTTTKEHEAVFNTNIIKKKGGKYTMTVIERGDQYGNRGNCVKDHLSPICDCLRETTSTSYFWEG